MFGDNMRELKTPRNRIECEHTKCKECIYVTRSIIDNPGTTKCLIRMRFQEEYNKEEGIIILEENTAVVAISAAIRIDDPERLKDIKFEEDFAKRCEYELRIAQKVRKDLDITSFIMGFVSGAKNGTECLKIN